MWRSSHRARGGHPAMAGEPQALTRRMSTENAGDKSFTHPDVDDYLVSLATIAEYAIGRDRADHGSRRPWRTWIRSIVSGTSDEQLHLRLARQLSAFEQPELFLRLTRSARRRTLVAWLV
jgi:hypothetical protein